MSDSSEVPPPPGLRQLVTRLAVDGCNLVFGTGVKLLLDKLVFVNRGSFAVVTRLDWLQFSDEICLQRRTESSKRAVCGSGAVASSGQVVVPSALALEVSPTAPDSLQVLSRLGCTQL